MISRKYKTSLIILLILLVSIGQSGAALPEEEWNRSYRGISYLHYVQETSDGGFILAGSGDSNFVLLKTDREGNEQWENSYSKAEKTIYSDIMWTSKNSVHQTLDKGYLFSGTLYIGDSWHENWIIKTDTEGREEWSRKIHDGNPFHETSDGGFIIAEWSGIKFSDIYLTKTDSYGKEQWRKTIERRQYEGRIESVLETSDGGYIAVWKTYICCDSWDHDLSLIKTDPDGNKQWNMTFQEFNRIQIIFTFNSPDGGIIIWGRNMQDLWVGKFGTDGKNQWNRTYSGFFSVNIRQVSDGFMIFGSDRILKIDPEGDYQWVNKFNASEVIPVLMTADGGYLFSGTNRLIKIKKITPAPLVLYRPKYPAVNQTITFNVSWNSNNVTNISYNWDFGDNTEERTISKIMAHSYSFEGDYTVNLSIMDGNTAISSKSIAVHVQKSIPPEELWHRTFGVSGDDYEKSAVQTADNGYIIAGDAKIQYGIGVLLVKTDQGGNEQWNVSFGGPDAQRGVNSILQTKDEGYIFTGSKRFFNSSGQLLWLVKTDPEGNMEWEKTFGGPGYNDAISVQETKDGGYIVAGIKELTGGGSIFGLLLIKTDSKGNEQWNISYREGGSNEVRSVQQTPDGGYIVAGTKYILPNTNAWILKTDFMGNKQWLKTFGGTGWNFITESVQLASDGGLIVGGKAWHSVVENTGYNEISNGWVMKTDKEGNKQWEKMLGQGNDDRTKSVYETYDGGYVFLVETHPQITEFPDVNFQLIKTDNNGNIQWHNTFGTIYDVPNSIQQTKDGGYILSGTKDSTGPQGADFFLLKVAPIDPGNYSTDQEKPDMQIPSTSDSDEKQEPSPNVAGLGMLLAAISLITVYVIRMKKKKLDS
ncbi:MAG: PKD domain-containing protein [Candidatus Methanoperedens sp.]|nr:PKD domain-containing protein [Candidatus Methanoperedens sp.]